MYFVYLRSEDAPFRSVDRTPFFQNSPETSRDFALREDLGSSLFRLLQSLSCANNSKGLPRGASKTAFLSPASIQTNICGVLVRLLILRGLHRLGKRFRKQGVSYRARKGERSEISNFMDLRSFYSDRRSFTSPVTRRSKSCLNDTAQTTTLT